MSAEKRVRVSIDPMGNATVDAEGFQGEGCADVTEQIEKALQGAGSDVVKVKKPSWHETEDVHHVQEIQQG